MAMSGFWDEVTLVFWKNLGLSDGQKEIEIYCYASIFLLVLEARGHKIYCYCDPVESKNRERDTVQFVWMRRR